MKIIKGGGGLNIKPYSIEEFSAPIERGERNYALTSFGDEKSIQESAADNKLKASGAAVFASPPVKRKSLFSSYNDEDDSTGIFNSYVTSHNKPAESLDTKAESQKLLEQIFSQDLTQTGGDFQDFSFHEEEPENLNILPSQKDIVEKNSEVQQLEEENNELRKQIEELNSQNAQILAEKGELEAKLNELPALCEKARNEGYAAAKKDFDRIEKAVYEADKADYLQKMQESWEAAVLEIKKVDEKIAEIDGLMPEIVLSYVKDIVGTERILNDGIIVNVVRQALDHLKDLQQIVFSVNAADAQIIAEKFPQYGVSIDAAVPKGSVKVRTKIGEVSLSIDNWMENLRKQIDEQLAAAKANQAKE
jgi:flagellar biosynthesis/type III secretory pathway protein FliH